MSQRLHGWEQKRAYLAESWGTRTHTDAPLARMLWLHRRIRATTVYAACRARTARVELAAFDYAHLRRRYARGRAALASRMAFVELARNRKFTV